MIIEPLGDSAFIIRDLPGPAYATAQALADLHDPRILDVNASYETIGVYTGPGELTINQLNDLLASQPTTHIRHPKRHEIPVLYDGGDLKAVAQQFSLDPLAVIEIHCSQEYTCFAVGFCPGFPYLGWLHESIQGVPRMNTPRTHTAPGSVAITGKQTAIYPLDRPGGWPLIGRTPITLVDVDDNYFPIRAGDVVSFEPLLDEDAFRAMKGERL